MAKVVYSKNAPEAIGPYSQAIISGDFLFTSGQIAINPSSGKIEQTTVEEQTRVICANLSEIFASAGISFDNVVKTVCYLTDMDSFSDFNTVYEEYFVSKPARSCVAVKQLPKNALVEIEVVCEL